jgi:hypothetical protein
MTVLPIPTIRPSALPALAQCSRFESDGEPHAEAERGLLLDRLYRQLITLRWEPTATLKADELEPADFEALRWALEQTGALSDIEDLTADRDKCRIEIPLMAGYEGEVDAFTLRRRRSFDLKSGLERDHTLQMASYALGFMTREFLGEWETVLLFCDEQKLVRRSWSLDEAEELIRSVIDKVRSPETGPTLCSFCGWCKWKLTCPARLEELAIIESVAKKLDAKPDRFVEILNSPELLGRFLRGMAIADDYREKAKPRAVELLLAGTKVPHCSLRQGNKNEFADLAPLLPILDPEQKDALLKEFGTVSGRKLRAVLGDAAAKKHLSTKIGDPFVVVKT